MELSALALDNFRNYRQADIALSPGVNLFYGDNAQGKTNLLESVYLCSRLRSFRAGHNRELMRQGSPHSRVTADFSAFGRQRRLEITLREGRATQVKVNGVAKKTLAEASGLLYCVLFSPEDLSLVRGAPGGRRGFLDSAIALLRPSYGEYLAQYNRLLLHKSRMLRDDSGRFLPLWEDYSRRLCAIGGRMVQYRQSFVSRFAPLAADYHSQIAPGEQLTVSYLLQTGQEAPPDATAQQYQELLWQHMQSHYQAELASKKCLSGLQRDDLQLSINSQPARLYASQGQCRTAALALKLAERHMMEKDTGEKPILLLDDVLSELDAHRQKFVLSQMGGGQSIITCCENDKTGLLQGGRAFLVQNGQVEEKSL